MKLYNLFESIILEEVEYQRRLLTEGVANSDVIGAINGKYNVNIEYRDYEDQPPSTRYIQVYVLGTTTAGNTAIRAYQIQGGTTTEIPDWKMFRTDRIVNWTPTKMKWKHPVSDFDASIPAYNQGGDATFASIIAQVDPSTFGRQRSDIGQKPNRPEPEPRIPKEPLVNKQQVNRPEKPRYKPVPKAEPELAPEPAPKAVQRPAQRPVPTAEPNNAEEENL